MKGWERVGNIPEFLFYENRAGGFVLTAAAGNTRKGTYGHVTIELAVEDTFSSQGKTLQETLVLAKQRAVKRLISELRGTTDLLSGEGLCGKARRHSGLLSIANQLMLF